MKGVASPRISVIITANLEDEARLKNFVYMMQSIAMQQEASFRKLYIGLYVGVKDHQVNFQELFTVAAGKRWECVKFQSFKPHFVQMQYLLTHKIKDDDQWILFTHDDGLWHPLRVFVYEKHVKHINMHEREEHKVSCIACPENTHYKTAKHIPLTSYADVDQAIGRQELIIACKTPDKQSILELYNICIPVSVLREFFHATHHELWCNAYAEVALCDWLMEYRHEENYRTIQFQVKTWTYMWRKADPTYTVLSGSQLSAAHFMCKHPAELVIYMDVLAQMSCVFSMKETAKVLFDNMTRGQPADIVTMLDDKLQSKIREKPWVIKPF